MKSAKSVAVCLLVLLLAAKFERLSARKVPVSYESEPSSSEQEDEEVLLASRGTDTQTGVDSPDAEGDSIDEDDPVDRKDTRVPETNEINPYKLFPPQFHALLDIPIHDYGNGTTYNPHDKFKPHKVAKTPLVSGGYSSTRNQGFTSTTPKPETTTTYKELSGSSDYDYDYDSSYGHRTTKPTKRPKVKTTTTVSPTPPTRAYKPKQKLRTTTTTTTTEAYVDYEEDSYPTTKRPRPTYDENFTRRPLKEAVPPQYTPETNYEPHDHYNKGNRPYYANTGSQATYPQHSQEPAHEEEEPPVYIPQTYNTRPTAKPFYAEQNHYNPGEAPVEEENPDAVYDYDDDRNKDVKDVYFVNSNPKPNPTQATRPPQRYTGTYIRTTTPVYENYDKESVPQQQFRPSIPLDSPFSDEFLPRPETSYFEQSGFIGNQQTGRPQPGPSFQSNPPQGGLEQPRPPFLSNPIARPPPQPQAFREGQQPNVQPNFRPNPAGELPAPRPAPQQSPDTREPLRRPPPPGGIRPFREPLPSALQSPFAQISQAVANFFGRRSSNQRISKRSTASLFDPEDLVAQENANRPFVLFTRPQQPVHRSDTEAPQVQQLVGIQSGDALQTADGQKPPAFYLYTSESLRKGERPYLVVGPQAGPPPVVQGAKLVHTIAALPRVEQTPADRRHDLPVEGVRLETANALPQPVVRPGFRRPLPPPTSQQGVNRVPVIEAVTSAPVLPQRRPNGNEPSSFRFPVDDPQVPVHAYFPNPGPSPPPRVPLNPEKDVASPYLDPVPFPTQPVHINPAPQVHSHPPLKQDYFFEEPLKQPFKVSQNVDFSAPLHQPQPVQSTFEPATQPLIETEPDRLPLQLSSALPLIKADSKPFQLPKEAHVEETTTESTTTTTTPAPATQTSTKETPVKYSTIQQEDGKQIAVVLPAYVVTYRPKAGVPELEDSNYEGQQESLSSPQEWHFTGSELVPKQSYSVKPTVQRHSEVKPYYESGFAPSLN